ncbi:short-chain type dehydrogenase/reductase, partial [Phtheirospermum japonicum]
SSPVAIAVKADVSNPDDVKLLFDRAEQAYNTPAHILVNYAGIGPKHPDLANTTVEFWDTIFEVNARGAFLACREAANRLVRGGGGKIVTVSTLLVAAPTPGCAAYAASKAAVETMTRVVAKELKGSGITANCVSPGATATDMLFAAVSKETVQGMVDSCPMGPVGRAQ